MENTDQGALRAALERVWPSAVIAQVNTSNRDMSTGSVKVEVTLSVSGPLSMDGARLADAHLGLGDGWVYDDHSCECMPSSSGFVVIRWTASRQHHAPSANRTPTSSGSQPSAVEAATAGARRRGPVRDLATVLCNFAIIGWISYGFGQYYSGSVQTAICEHLRIADCNTAPRLAAFVLWALLSAMYAWWVLPSRPWRRGLPAVIIGFSVGLSIVAWLPTPAPN